MPRADTSKGSARQKRQAEHIEEDSLGKRGTVAEEAASRAWATINKESGGGNKSGRGKDKAVTKVSRKTIGGGKKGGVASASRTAAKRSGTTKKAAATRKSNQGD